MILAFYLGLGQAQGLPLRVTMDDDVFFAGIIIPKKTHKSPKK